jgi:hypothetical protein
MKSDLQTHRPSRSGERAYERRRGRLARGTGRRGFPKGAEGRDVFSLAFVLRWFLIGTVIPAYL